MFYSTEILTSRKYGVATVWLVATLGSKSNLKKVTRKAIVEVDVQKACATISEPEAPLALRLQSNLLYGIARVYSQQCGYVLHDAEAAKNSLRDVFKVKRTSALEPEGAQKGRADQLILQDDPNFLPDFDLMPLDLGRLDFDTPTAGESQRETLTPYGSQHTPDWQQHSGGLILPQSVSSIVGGPVGGFGSFGRRGDSGVGSRYEHAALLDDDLGLSFDPEGDVAMVAGPVRQPAGPAIRGERTDPGSFDRFDDVGFVPLQDDDIPMVSHTREASMPGSQEHEQTLHTTSTETADAPMRRHTRAPRKAIPVDTSTELRNSDLARWSTDYAANMMVAMHHKHALKAAAFAKKNAEYWIQGAGLGCLDSRADQGSEMFSAVQILEKLLNIPIDAHDSQKRSRADDSSDSDRRVRSRREPLSQELPRDGFQDDYMPMVMDDTIEQGREAPTPLDDRRFSTALPWNSGSQRPTNLLSTGGPSTSAKGHPFMPLSRRTSRLISQSPLGHRGANDLQLEPGLELDDLPHSDLSLHLTGADEFELFGPAADVDTQTAAQSQWQRRILDGESANFLAFVHAGIHEADARRADARPGDDEDDDRLAGSVELETLLPGSSNSCIVAAQALLHVLSLGTKNLLRVEQGQHYGAISMRVDAAH